MINWPLERDIWDRTFRRVLKVDPQDCSLLVTEPLFNLPALMARATGAADAPLRSARCAHCRAAASPRSSNR